jgi:flagellar protein FlgJ
VFLQMVLKAMRDASPKDGLFDSEQGHMYQSLLDQQLAQVLSARGSTGLAAMIEKQLSRGLVAEQNVPLSPAAAGERAGERGPNPLPARRGERTRAGAGARVRQSPVVARP